MTKVAADFGISDVALKKIYDKHRIPVPGRGYWAKKAAGKKVDKAHFRAISDPGIERITIYGSPLQDLPEQVKEARAAAKKRETSPENIVEIGSAPSEYHPTVERTRKKLEHAKPLETGLLSVSGEGLFNVVVVSGERRTCRDLPEHSGDRRRITWVPGGQGRGVACVLRRWRSCHLQACRSCETNEAHSNVGGDSGP